MRLYELHSLGEPDAAERENNASADSEQKAAGGSKVAGLAVETRKKGDADPIGDDPDLELMTEMATSIGVVSPPAKWSSRGVGHGVNAGTTVDKRHEKAPVATDGKPSSRSVEAAQVLAQSYGLLATQQFLSGGAEVEKLMQWFGVDIFAATSADVVQHGHHIKGLTTKRGRRLSGSRGLPEAKTEPHGKTVLTSVHPATGNSQLVLPSDGDELLRLVRKAALHAAMIVLEEASWSSANRQPGLPSLQIHLSTDNNASMEELQTVNLHWFLMLLPTTCVDVVIRASGKLHNFHSRTAAAAKIQHHWRGRSQHRQQGEAPVMKDSEASMQLLANGAPTSGTTDSTHDTKPAPTGDNAPEKNSATASLQRDNAGEEREEEEVMKHLEAELSSLEGSLNTRLAEALEKKDFARAGTLQKQLVDLQQGLRNVQGHEQVSTGGEQALGAIQTSTSLHLSAARKQANKQANGPL